MSRNQARTLLNRYWVPPQEIEARSFQIISRLLSTDVYTEHELQIVKRVVHTTGDPGMAELLHVSADAIASGIDAIRAGRTIYTDVKMASAGVNRTLASRFGCEVSCLIDHADIPEIARRDGVTRAAAGVRHHAGAIDGSVVAIGNAPTALFALLDLVDSGLCRPALVVGVPVGFVGAAESKAELAARNLPQVTVQGTRGGSTVAVAILNALLIIAFKDGPDASF